MYKGIDVSTYQRNGIDYDKLKQDGVEFAILKIIRKDLEKDNGFEQHYSGFNHAQIPIIGVYNYSYASTVDKFKTDAEAVVKALNGRKKKVWLDIENETQMGIGDTLIDGINAYFGVLKDYGLDYGIYTVLNFYNTYLKKYEPWLTVDMWIARYYNGYNKMKLSDVVNEAKEPSVKNLIAWQYSSSGDLTGYNGNIDLNLYYGEFDKSVLDDRAYVVKGLIK